MRFIFPVARVITAILLSLLLYPSLGFAQNTLPSQQRDVVQVPQENKKPFISDGSPIKLPEVEAEITPPVGWKVSQNLLGMTLVMEAPKKKKISTDRALKDQTRFRPNITVTNFHGSHPIDAKQAELLKERIGTSFSKVLGNNTSFQVAGEHKFFDYQGKNDGLILFSTFEANATPMTQMHLFVSGENEAFLITYTDMSANFASDEALYDTAWAAMSSIKVKGAPRGRYNTPILFGIGALATLLAAGGLLLYRRRKVSELYDEVFDDELINSELDDDGTGTAELFLDEDAEKPITGFKLVSNTPTLVLNEL